MEADPNVLVIAGDQRVMRLVIGERTFEVRPMPLPVLEEFVRVGGTGLMRALNAAFAGESATPDWPAIILEHGPSVRRAVQVASGVPQDTVDALDLGQMLRLTDAVLGLNIDFFVQRVRPALGSLVRTMSEVAQRASRAHSHSAAQH